MKTFVIGGFDINPNHTVTNQMKSKEILIPVAGRCDVISNEKFCEIQVTVSSRSGTVKWHHVLEDLPVLQNAHHIL